MERKDQFPEFEPDYTEVEKRQKQQEANEKELRQNQRLHDNRQEGNDQQQANEKELQQNNQSDDNQKEQKLNDLIHDIDNKQGRNF